MQILKFIFAFLALFSLFSCTSKKGPQITINQSWLDSIKAKADTNYTKTYRNQDFATAEYYINRKDSIACQLMKDATGMIRQVIVAKKDTKLFSAEYYPNGQLMASLSLDADGKKDGAAINYYENGAVKAKGNYSHGLFKGTWMNYDTKGKYISSDVYDENGQLVK